jgi:hypothetical protein
MQSPEWSFAPELRLRQCPEAQRCNAGATRHAVTPKGVLAGYWRHYRRWVYIFRFLADIWGSRAIRR